MKRLILVIFIILSCSINQENKAQWYEDALYLMIHKYTAFKAMIVYSDKWENEDGTISDLRINSDEEALESFKNSISSEYFIDTIITNDSSVVFPEKGYYIGVFPGWGEFEDSVEKERLDTFRTLTLKRPVLVPFSVFFGEDNRTGPQLDKIHKTHAVPIVRFMPWHAPYWSDDKNSIDLEDIINGKYDEFLTIWSDIIKDKNYPVIATFGVEMNGNWFPWSGIYQGGSKTTIYGDTTKADGPEKFKDAYIHIINLFKSYNVNNVMWMYQINNISYPDEKWNSIDAYYPGNEYIDIIGVSVYGAQYNDDDWISFGKAMDTAYNKLCTTFKNKIKIIAEWGVKEP